MKRPKLAAYLKRKGNTEDEVLAAADPNEPTPDHIKLEYPRTGNSSTNTPSEGQQPDVSPLTLMTPSWATTHSGSLTNHSTRLPTPVSFPVTPFEQRSLLEFRGQRELPAFNVQALSTNASVNHQPKLPSRHPSQPDMPESPTYPPHSSEASNIWAHLDGLESYNNVINQILRPDSPVGSAATQLNVFKTLSGSRRVSSHEELIRGLDRQCRVSDAAGTDTSGNYNGADVSHNFLARFFAGCILRRQGASEAADGSFWHANDILEAMIKGCHPECLTTLNLMLSVLEVHGQRHLAGDFLSKVLLFSGENRTINPVAATVEFMVKVATRAMNIVEVDLVDLHSIYEQLQARFGLDSPSALVGLYHVAWRSAKAEEHREGSLETLKQLVPAAIKVLGPSHFLTITCMTTMARVLSYVGTLEDCISRMGDVLRVIDVRCAPFHPYRLEALYRLALYLVDAHDPVAAERLLREVVEERVNVLGQTNDLTIRSLESLQDVLVLMGKHVELDDLRSDLLSPTRVNPVCEASKAYLLTTMSPQAVAVGA